MSIKSKGFPLELITDAIFGMIWTLHGNSSRSSVSSHGILEAAMFGLWRYVYLEVVKLARALAVITP